MTECVNPPDDLVSAVPVEVICTEWANGEESDEEEMVQKHLEESSSARDRRLTEAAEVLSNHPIIGDTDVDVIAETKDWAGAEAVGEEDPAQIDKHMKEVFEAREERLRRVSDELEKEQIIGDNDVEVVVVTTEWSGADAADMDDGDDNVEGHLSKAYAAREERISKVSEELDKENMIGDTDVEVMRAAREWVGEAMMAEDSADDFDRHAKEVFQEREKRLTVAAEELDKGLTLGDTDVEVITENKEWAQLGEDDDEKDTSEQHANEVFEIRERRLTAAAEELHKGGTIGDTDVEVIVEGKEWAQLGEDGDDEKNSEQHATEIFEIRERRLTVAAEELEKELTIGDTDVHIVNEGREWTQLDDNDDDDGSDAEQHANEVFAVRERRLTAAAEELQKELTLGDTDVHVVIEGSEWTQLDDDEEDTSDAEKHANELFEMRERRLTVAAEELEKGLTIGDGDVEVVCAGNEWDALDDDDDESIEKHAADMFKVRERRLTVSEEVLQLGVDAQGQAREDSRSLPEEPVPSSSSSLPGAKNFRSITREFSYAEYLNDKTSDWFASLAVGEEDVEMFDRNGALMDPAEEAMECSFPVAVKARVLDDEQSDASLRSKDNVGQGTLGGALDTHQFNPIAQIDAETEAGVVQPALTAEEEEESEWETEEETDDEIFKRANPDRGLRRANDANDPWRNVFKWIAGVVKHRRTADEVPKALDALVGPDDLSPAALTPDSLCDGKLLCALMMALRPEAIRKPIPNAMGRLGQVVKACKQFGVRDADLFGVPDIISSPPQNPNAVLRCLTALSGVVARWEDYSGPKLRGNR